MLPKTDYLPFSELEETRDVALVTSAPAWDAVKDSLRLKVVWRYDVTEAEETAWLSASATLHGDVLYAVGGGLAVDAAKYLAAKHGLPLICLPTVLSVDAFLTWASGVRHDGCVTYIETKPPERLIIDFAVLAAAPVAVRAAGMCDVLSIATGLWDWRYAHDRGKNPPNMSYIPYVETIAQGILQGALDCAEAAGQGDKDGLKQLLDCLALEVQLCNQIGHSRPEEGSEHYFAYSVENVMGKGLPHGDLVGPGIVLMAALQEQNIAPLIKALHACYIPLNNIPADVIAATIRDLAAYSTYHNLPYGIAHDVTAAHLAHLPSLA
jgi:glycerol-1-phosphate dehydrogenase [NAD(P)+]